MEDLDRQRGGECVNARMLRLCLPLVNSINEDLEFTAETPEDFPLLRLPTLDFSLWQDVEGKIHHTYFQKEMKTPFIIMRRSAISWNQKISILANDYQTLTMQDAPKLKGYRS